MSLFIETTNPFYQNITNSKQARNSYNFKKEQEYKKIEEAFLSQSVDKVTSSLMRKPLQNAFGITVHFLDQSMSHAVLLLGSIHMSEKHDFQHIADIFSDVFARFDINVPIEDNCSCY